MTHPTLSGYVPVEVGSLSYEIAGGQRAIPSPAAGRGPRSVESEAIRGEGAPLRRHAMIGHTP
jgi:hypothetical protein